MLMVMRQHKAFEAKILFLLEETFGVDATAPTGGFASAPIVGEGCLTSCIRLCPNIAYCVFKELVLGTGKQSCISTVQIWSARSSQERTAAGGHQIRVWQRCRRQHHADR